MFCCAGKDEIAGDGDDEDGYDEDGMREILGTTQSIGEHAFSKMEENVDKRRLMKNKSTVAVSATEEEQKAV